MAGVAALIAASAKSAAADIGQSSPRHDLHIGFRRKRDFGAPARRLYDAKRAKRLRLYPWSDIDEYSNCEHRIVQCPGRNCNWDFSHAGASGGQFTLDAEAQVFFSVNASNQLVWNPAAGISITAGFYPINVSAMFSGYDAEDSQFIIQVTP